MTVLLTAGPVVLFAALCWLGWWLEERYATVEHPRRRLWWMVTGAGIGVSWLVFAPGWWRLVGAGIILIDVSEIQKIADPSGLRCWAARGHDWQIHVRTVTIWSRATDGVLIAQDGPITVLACSRCGKDHP